jgi:hypothetical protein
MDLTLDAHIQFNTLSIQIRKTGAKLMEHLFEAQRRERESIIAPITFTQNWHNSHLTYVMLSIISNLIKKLNI